MHIRLKLRKHVVYEPLLPFLQCGLLQRHPCWLHLLDHQLRNSGDVRQQRVHASSHYLLDHQLRNSVDVRQQRVHASRLLDRELRSSVVMCQQRVHGASQPWLLDRQLPGSEFVCQQRVHGQIVGRERGGDVRCGAARGGARGGQGHVVRPRLGRPQPLGCG